MAGIGERIAKSIRGGEALTMTKPLPALQHEIALILDHPSVYMGGPSQQSIRKAERIVRHMERCGLIAQATADGELKDG